MTEEIKEKSFTEKVARKLALQRLLDSELHTEDRVWNWVIKHDFTIEYFNHANQVIDLFRQLVEEIENPYKPEEGHLVLQGESLEAFEECRQAILKKLEE